ncbi:hypothetical protein ACFV9C_03880 [Kribbella sp. NPDC059898]|uniref:hypothetical protein n=1 Tax=Kribbella sp. NPDC059898 TaxID=3346995 RepID=UPI003655D667
MGQFTRYVESYHPPLLNRILGVVVPVSFIVRAVLLHTFESILWAVLLAVIMLLPAIAPETTKNRSMRWERNHPVQFRAFSLLTMICGFYLILRWFLDRPHSILIGLALSLLFFTTMLLVRRK